MPPDEAPASQSFLADTTHRLNLTDSELVGAGLARRQQLCDQFTAMMVDLETLPAQQHFRIVRRLGRGRQGIVLEAANRGYLDCTTRHALKFFDPSLFAGNRTYDVDMVRIARQVSVLQQLYHPNLVQCESFHEHAGIGVLVMELIDGIDIRNLLDQPSHRALAAALPAAEWTHFNSVIFAPEQLAIQPGVAIYLLRNMLRGLEILHRTGYIHCDIKPSNVMIDRFGTAKLIDFGRATRVNDAGDNFLASPMYMAPELHRREALSPLCDLYSCGIVVLEMLHGDPLIDQYSTEPSIIEFKKNLPGQIGDFLPGHLRRNRQLLTVLNKLLAANPADRYRNAHEADAGAEGARIIHRQLAKVDLDADYGLELENYLARRLPRSSLRSRDP